MERRRKTSFFAPRRSTGRNDSLASKSSFHKRPTGSSSVHNYRKRYQRTHTKASYYRVPPARERHPSRSPSLRNRHHDSRKSYSPASVEQRFYKLSSSPSSSSSLSREHGSSKNGSSRAFHRCRSRSNRDSSSMRHHRAARSSYGDKDEQCSYFLPRRRFIEVEKPLLLTEMNMSCARRSGSPRHQSRRCAYDSSQCLRRKRTTTSVSHTTLRCDLREKRVFETAHHDATYSYLRSRRSRSVSSRPRMEGRKSGYLRQRQSSSLSSWSSHTSSHQMEAATKPLCVSSSFLVGEEKRSKPSQRVSHQDTYEAHQPFRSRMFLSSKRTTYRQLEREELDKRFNREERQSSPLRKNGLTFVEKLSVSRPKGAGINSPRCTAPQSSTSNSLRKSQQQDLSQSSSYPLSVYKDHDRAISARVVPSCEINIIRPPLLSHIQKPVSCYAGSDAVYLPESASQSNKLSSALHSPPPPPPPPSNCAADNRGPLFRPHPPALKIFRSPTAQPPYVIPSPSMLPSSCRPVTSTRGHFCSPSLEQHPSVILSPPLLNAGPPRYSCYVSLPAACSSSAIGSCGAMRLCPPPHVPFYQSAPAVRNLRPLALNSTSSNSLSLVPALTRSELPECLEEGEINEGPPPLVSETNHFDCSFSSTVPPPPRHPEHLEFSSSASCCPPLPPPPSQRCSLPARHATGSRTQKTKPCIVEVATEDDGTQKYNEEAWTIGSVTLLPKVLEQLDSGGLLDDTALEFFFRFLHRYVLPPSQSNRLFFFNSYFYTKLVKGGANAKARHAAVRRWTNRLFSQCSRRSSCLSPSVSMNSKEFVTLDSSPPTSYAVTLNTTDSTELQRENETDQNTHSYLWDFNIVVIPLHNTAHHWALGLVCYPFLAIKTPEGYEADESTAQTEHNSTPFPSYGLNDEDQHTLRRTASQLEAQQVGTVRFPELSPQHKSDSLLMVVCSSDSENDQDAVAENHAQFSVIASGANTMDSSLNSNAYEQNWVTQRVATSAQVVRFQGIPGPAIFYLDSLKDTSGPPPQLKEVIVEYFQEEFRERCPSLYAKGFHIADASEWYYAQVPAPHQTNYYDCGVFLIEYLRHLLTVPERIKTLLYGSITQIQKAKLEGAVGDEKFITEKNVDWFDQVLVTYRRQCLKKILTFMQQNPQWKCCVYEKQEDSDDMKTPNPLSILLELFNSDKEKESAQQECELSSDTCADFDAPEKGGVKTPSVPSPLSNEQ